MSNELSTIVNEQRNTFLAVAADKTINFEREAEFALQILNGNEYLAKVAMSNKSSLVAAINNVAAIGITLNPAQKLAYLVPRKGAVCLDVSYMGLMYLAQVSGAIQWGQAVIVRANDHFEIRGVDKEPIHTYSPFGERGEIIGCYAVVKTDSGDYLTEAMSKAQIDDIKVRSEAWKAYEKNGTKCPWVTDYEEMAKKTVVKRAAKYWPRRERLDKAVHYLNTDVEEGIVFEQPRTAVPAIPGFEDIASTGPITAKAAAEDAMAAMPLEEQDFLRSIAKDVVKLIEAGDPLGATQHLAEQRLNNEEKLAIWSLFDSKQRTAMRKATEKAQKKDGTSS